MKKITGIAFVPLLTYIPPRWISMLQQMGLNMNLLPVTLPKGRQVNYYDERRT
ncbi:MAG: hypothetical protein Q8930_13060 [Bacillota bacterium]|nr:hypothetical protein [Bacillota bacterium]